MHPYSYTISLGVEHPSFNLIEIYKILSQIPGIIPGRLCNAGEERTTPRGDKLEGVYRKSSCGFGFYKDNQQSESTRIPEAIPDLVERLYPHKETFNKFVANGGSLSFFIGWFMDGNSGDHFSPELLQRLAELGLDLDFDVYCSSDAELSTKDQATKDSYAYQDTYEYKLGFRMSHPSKTLTEPFEVLSEVPGFIPNGVWKVGDQRRGALHGEPLEGRYGNAYCSFSFSKEWQRSDDEPSSVAALKIVNQLSAHKQMLLDVVDSGGTLQLWDSWYVLSNGRAVFDTTLLKTLAELKIELVLDMYPPDQ